MMNAEFLIIGQGLAGTCLAHKLLQKGKTIKILQNNALASSSKVAGGMFNPVTGKRLAKTWMQEEIFPFMDDFYTDLEVLMKETFLHKMQIYRPFKNENQKSQFLKAIKHKELENLIVYVNQKEELKGIINEPLGGISTSESGRLDVPLFLEKSAEYFKEKSVLEEGNFDINELKHDSQNIEYKGVKYQSIIFCEGVHVTSNPFFNWLPFNPVKGETLDVVLDGSQFDCIVNQGSWIMPLGDGKYKMGSTYDWDNLNFETTEIAKESILEKSNSFLKPKVTVVAQFAGIRPAVEDRRPILGAHPIYKNILIFNGLGTKGVSLAPFFSNQLAEYLTDGKEINLESTIQRFYPLYS